MRTCNLRLLALCILVASATFQSACAGDPPVVVTASETTTPQTSGQHSASHLLQAIRAEIGEALCDVDSQCHSVGVGAKSCGGPEGYLAWSSQHTNRERLLDLVAQHREARRLEHLSSGILSNCRVLPDPGAACLPRGPAGQRACQLLNAVSSKGRSGAP